MTEEIRINKFLSDEGIASRREADSLIEMGKILVNGVEAILGQKLKPGDEVTLKHNHKEEEQNFLYLGKENEKIYLAFNKPKGIICTCDKNEEKSIINYINFPQRIYPVGRLDQNSTGLILLTNDGAFANELSHPRYQHEKEYRVSTQNTIDEKFIKQIKEGVKLEEKLTSPCQAEKLEDHKFKIILKEGLNRQIRRMCEKLGNPVTNLKRVRIVNLRLENLKEGNYVKIGKEKLKKLFNYPNDKASS